MHSYPERGDTEYTVWLDSTLPRSEQIFLVLLTILHSSTPLHWTQPLLLKGKVEQI